MCSVGYICFVCSRWWERKKKSLDHGDPARNRCGGAALQLLAKRARVITTRMGKVTLRVLGKDDKMLLPNPPERVVLIILVLRQPQLALLRDDVEDLT